MNDNIINILSLASELEEFIQQVIPKAQTVQKYGGTLFTLKPEEKEGQFCGVFAHKNHVQISFSKGAELIDPKGMLLGSGKFRRHVNIASSEEDKFNDLEDLLKQASAL